MIKPELPTGNNKPMTQKELNNTITKKLRLK